MRVKLYRINYIKLLIKKYTKLNDEMLNTKFSSIKITPNGKKHLTQLCHILQQIFTLKKLHHILKELLAKLKVLHQIIKFLHSI